MNVLRQQTPKPSRSPILLQILAAFFGSLVLFLFAIGAISSGYQLLFSGRVFPGSGWRVWTFRA